MPSHSLLVIPPTAVPSPPPAALDQGGAALTVVDPTGLAALPNQDLARYTSVSIHVVMAVAADALAALSTIDLSRISSMEKLTFKIRFVVPNYEETRRAWTCIIGVLAGLKGLSPQTPIAVFVEDAVPLTVLRASFGTDELNGLRRFLFGADKKLVTLVNAGTLSAVSFVLPPPATRYMLEEDEVRLKSLFQALRDYGMLLYP